MTGFTRPRSRNKDLDASVERGVWGSLEYIPDSGASMSVRGTGTLDEEVPLLNLGYGFNLPQDSDAEVVMLSLGSDVNDKVAIATIPRNLQHPWGEGQGGVQHPTDPDRRIEFNDTETWLTDGNYVLGDQRAISIGVVGQNVTISLGGLATVVITGNANFSVGGNTTINSGGPVTVNAPAVAVVGGSLTHNGVNVGDNHTHPGVQSGFSNTGGPQ